MKRSYGECIAKSEPLKYVYYDGTREAQDTIVKILEEQLPDYHLRYISGNMGQMFYVCFKGLEPWAFNEGFVYVFAVDYNGFPVPTQMGIIPTESVAKFDSLYEEIR